LGQEVYVLNEFDGRFKNALFPKLDRARRIFLPAQ